MRNTRAFPEALLASAVAEFSATLEPVLADRAVGLLGSAGKAAGRAMGRRPARRRRSASAERWSATGGVAFVFDATDPRAAAWARRYAAQRVGQLSRETLAALRKSLAYATEQNMSSAATARLIRPLLGLDEARSDALLNLRERILDNPGGKVWAGNRPIRVPEEVTDEYLEEKLDDYAEKLLNDRAAAVARTETREIAEEGQRQAWLQAAEEGLIDLDSDGREWLASPDACEECLAMDGAFARIDGDFEGPDGPVNIPLHPNCECSQGLALRIQ